MTGTCIEAVDISALFTQEYIVGCTATDVPDYLENKIVGTANRVTVSLIPGVNQTLQIDISPDIIDDIFPENPTCVSTYNSTGYATMTYDTTS
jgi:hypothetical protein